MDRLPRSNDGFANNNMFADSQQYNGYDVFQPGTDQNSYDASWGINASAYPGQSRAPQASAQAWPQNASHLSTAPTHAALNSQASPYARSLSQSPAPYGPNHFNTFGAQQPFQYRQPQYDPTLVPPHAYGHGFNYATANYQAPNAGTIAPHALEHEARPPTFNRSPYAGGDYPMGNTNQARPTIKSFSAENVDQKALSAAIPSSKPAGYFSIIDFDGLVKSTKSERMGNFVNIGTEARNWDVNRAALPVYVPRKSRSELRKIAGNDQKALSKIGKKSVKKERALTTVSKQLQSTSFAASPSADKIKYEGDSSSEEESSSDEDSDTSYSSDEATEPSPLPLKRPTSPREATEYDTTKAVWRGKRKNLSPDSIRKGIADFWEIAKTIRDRWKADSNAVDEAEKNNRENELPLLESRVKDQRDMMESAFKAVLKHGHRSIVELLSEAAALLYLCYQFLLDRIKAEDYNAPLSRVILETMTMFKTLTDAKLEKTHLIKLLPRFAKKGDARTSGYAKKIIANAAAGSEAQPEEPPKKDLSKGSASSPVGKRAEPEPVAGVKRAASTTGEGGIQKKLATTASKTTSTLSSIKQSAATKKPGSTVDSTKTTAPTITKAKPVTAKPSGMFSSLQSASKKPGTSITSKAGHMGSAVSKASEKSATTVAPTAAPKSTFSFAETMANLSKPKEDKTVPKPVKEIPQETPEEQAKRLRKESRRDLHVQFKTGDDLVQVRLFHHDPEEELGHDASQMRDVSDVGGEGRMFKQQHQMMDIDEDEDAAEEEEKLVEFKEPNLIDFSDVDEEERKRNYAPFGGGQIAPESSERAIRDYYEANNLIVFYTDPSDIPPNPREPSDPTNGEKVGTVKNFASPGEEWATRARQKKMRAPQQYGIQQASNANGANLAPGLDLSKIMSSQTQQPNTYQQPQQTNAMPNDAIKNILATLKQAGANQTASAKPPVGIYKNTYAPPPPTMNFQSQQPAPQPGPQIDLAAILAQINSGQNAAAQAPQMGGYSYNQAGAMPNMPGYGAQNQQPAVYENAERKQWREAGNNDANRKQRQSTAQSPYYKTKVCKYWQENKCQKGENCTYKHEE